MSLDLKQRFVLVDSTDEWYRVYSTDNVGRPDGWIQASKGTVVPGFNGNRALAFDGVDDYMRTSIYEVPPNVFTMMLWFKSSSESGGLMISTSDVEDGSSGVGDRRIYLNPEGNLYYGVFAPGVRTVNTTETYNDGRWYHVAATQSEEGLKLYVDGSLKGTDPTTTAETFAKYWILGYSHMRSDWPSRPFDFHYEGLLDDVSIWNRELSEGEIEAFAKANIGSIDLSNNPAVVSHWNFDRAEDLGFGDDGIDDIRDVSSNNNHGDLEGSSVVRTSVESPYDPTAGRDRIIIDQNFPNPFSDFTTLRFFLPVDYQLTSIRISDTLGRSVSVMAMGYKPSGWNEINFDGTSLPSGVYFYHIRGDDWTMAYGKLIILR